jgi:RNA polymerase sigma-70 factor (ECF subfamily)
MHDDMIRRIEPLIPALRRYARALCGDRAQADDLVQDCLERAISRWHQRRDDGNTRTWMFTILHNLAVNYWRQNRYRGPHIALDDTVETAFAHDGTQENSLHYQDVMGAIATLPDDQRSILLLVSIEDLSYAETAKVLDIPLGTVMSRLSRGRERLRQILDGDMRNNGDRQSTPNLRRVK